MYSATCAASTLESSLVRFLEQNLDRYKLISLSAVELGLVDELEASTKKLYVDKGNFDNFVHDGDELEQSDEGSEQEEEE